MYTYGYIRVSSRDQNEDRQRIAMREAGVEDARIYMDKQSGKTDCIFRFKKTDCFKATPHNPPSASSGKLRPDFVTFSCNTQSIPAKNCHHQNANFLEICSCRIMRCCLRKRPALRKEPPCLRICLTAAWGRS